MKAFLCMVVGVLILAGCGGAPALTPMAAATQTPTEIELATLAAPAPTATPAPTQAPPVAMTAQPAPEIQPTAGVVTVTSGTVPPLQSNLPGLLNKPLEEPSEWQQLSELMDGLPVFAWRCENESLKAFYRPAKQVTDLVPLLNDKPAFEQAVENLKAQGFQVVVSRPLVFGQALADLPFDQLADCRVQAALGLFGPAPASLPQEVGLTMAGRGGQVDGQPAYERLWLLVWK